MYKVYFIGPGSHNCNTIHTMYHSTQYCNTPQAAINTMQNEFDKVMILHNNNNSNDNNSKHL